MLATPTTRAFDPATDPPLSELALLNDALRVAGVGGVLIVSAGVITLGDHALPQILAAVRAYDAFTPGNDPHGDHSAGEVEWRGEHLLWRVDRYDLERRLGSPELADELITTRVLTITLAAER